MAAVTVPIHVHVDQPLPLAALEQQIVGLVDNLTRAETAVDLIEEIEALHQRLGVPMRPRNEWGSLYPAEAA